jgi:hypothetical protein
MLFNHIVGAAEKDCRDDAVFALANKIARIAWAIMVRDERYKEPKLLLAA